MIRLRTLSGIFVIIALQSALLTAGLRVESYKKPKYPPAARIAHIAGAVVLSFVMDKAGVPKDVQLISGHPFLATAALENFSTWRFSVAGEPADRTRQKITYQFEISYDLDTGHYDPTKEQVRFDGFMRVIYVTTAPQSEFSEANCPEPGSKPPSVSLGANDFVKLTRTTCYGPCPAYEATVYADGRVAWDGHQNVEVSRHRIYPIPASKARALIERFRTSDVWALCGDYRRSVTDSSSAVIEISIAGERKVIQDYARSSPEWFWPLATEVDRVANTHALVHSAPATERLSNIGREYLSKPGITALITAAAGADLAGVRRLLAEHSPVNAQDSSGWTALMYAAASYDSSKVVTALIRAGADPKHVSRRGDTVLMAAAVRGRFDVAMARLVGDVNAQNREGVTVLMMLAQDGTPVAIQAALKFGANPTLVDSKNRSALDYLNLGRPNAGRDDYRKSLKLLRAAAAAQ